MSSAEGGRVFWTARTEPERVEGEHSWAKESGFTTRDIHCYRRRVLARVRKKEDGIKGESEGTVRAVDLLR